jgi:hypothetical protein
MLVGWLMAAAFAGDVCADPQALQQDSSGFTSLVVRVDGGVNVLPSPDGNVSVESCGGTVKLVRKGQVLELVGRKPVEGVTVRLPPTVTHLTAHQHVGALSVEVPAAVAVISSEGPLTVKGAQSLRVSWHEGDVTVEDITADLLIDRVTGTVNATSVGGSARVDGVTGQVAVESKGELLVDGKGPVTLAP